MRKNIMGALTCVAGLALQAGCATEQPAPDCLVQRANASPFAVKYIPVGTPQAGCEVLKTDLWGVQRFMDTEGKPTLAFKPFAAGLRNVDAAQKTQVTTERAGDVVWAPAFKASLSRTIGLLTDAPMVGQLPADDRPDANNICAVSGAMESTSTMTALMGPAANEGNFTCETDEDGNTTCTLAEGVKKDVTYAGAARATYTMQNTQVYMSARSPGQSWQADVKYVQEVTAADGTKTTCTQDFKAVAIWPAAACNDDIDCDPCADPYNTERPRFTGSGLNPDVAVQCDKSRAFFGGYAGICVMKSESVPGFMSDAEIEAAAKTCAERQVPPAN